MRGGEGHHAQLPVFDRIIADSDLDGLCAAAVLKSYNPDAEVIFSHAALVRSGKIDEIITPSTAMVDLPFHPNCGWYLDHHQTNRPNLEEEINFTKNGGVCNWEATPSAARLAYNLLSPIIDLSHLEEIMPIVDALDSGQITLEEFLEDSPVLQLSRTISMKDIEYTQQLLELFSQGNTIHDILSDELVQQRVSRVRDERKKIQEYVSKNTQIINRLAICRLENTGYHSNGYLVTAWAGGEADACCIIHGFDDGTVDDPNRPALSASFYANSFLPNGQNRYDLSKLATALDDTGGGMLTRVVAGYNLQGLKQILSYGWICGIIETKF